MSINGTKERKVRAVRVNSYPGGASPRTGNHVSFDDIDNESLLSLEDFRGAYCIGGVNLFIITDLTCASLLFMERGNDRKYICQMYWPPTDRLAERVQQDKISYDKWFDRGLLRLCTGNSINYFDVTAWFVETVKQ